MFQRIGSQLCIASVLLVVITFDMRVQSAETFSVDPTSTFLRTLNDGLATGPVIIELATLQIPASFGETLRLESVGAYSFNSSPIETDTDLLGIFSATDEVVDGSNQFRVPGAIDAGDDFVTNPFSFLVPPIPADITEDFLISNSVIEVAVPAGANFLLLGTFDNFYGDNVDANRDFGVRISAVPEPSSALLIAAAIGCVAGRRRLRSSRS